jgi:hypothetical protein
VSRHLILLIFKNKITKSVSYINLDLGNIHLYELHTLIHGSKFVIHLSQETYDVKLDGSLAKEELKGAKEAGSLGI